MRGVIVKECEYPVLGEEKRLPFYIVAIGRDDENDVLSSEKGLPYLQMFICLNGKGRVRINNSYYSVVKNCAFFVLSGETYEICRANKEMQICWISFYTQCENLFKQYIYECSSHQSIIDDSNIILAFFNELMSSSKSGVHSCGCKCSGQLYSMILEIMHQNRFSTVKNKNMKMNQIEPIIQYMIRNLDKDVTLEELSHVVALTPQYICRLFKECLNERPFEYISKLRIRQAKKLLAETDLSVLEVGKRVGYDDSSYFCSVFKKIEKLTPVEYRSMYKK